MGIRMSIFSILKVLLKVSILVPVAVGLGYLLGGYSSFKVNKIVEVMGFILIILGLITILEKYKFGLVNLLSGIMVLIIGLNFLSPTVYGLSTDEKLEDFEYLFSFMSENFPLISANERAFGVNWLDNKESFRKAIENNTTGETTTISNSMFTLEISNITRQLFNSLTHPVRRGFFSSNQVLTNPQYDNNFELWNNVIKDENVLRWYGIELEEGQEPPSPFDRIGMSFIGEDNWLRTLRTFGTDIIVPGEIAYLRIFSMSDLRVEADGKLIREFLEEVKDFDKLIIDVRDNSSGIDDYWKQNLIAPLIKEEVSVENYFFIRGEYTKKFYKSRGIELFPVSDLDERLLPKFPEGIQEEFQYYGIHTVRVQPVDPIDFKGNIYLLTNRGVRGSAERFTNFVKDAGLASLVGSVTAGNAPIFEPIILSLPNSGMLIRYRGDMAINGDGNITSHVGTIPHITIHDTTIRMPAYEADELVSYILRNR